MKLRFGTNSVRLRLRRSDVDRLAETGQMEESIRFGPVETEQFSYLVRIEPRVREIQASYGKSQLIIGVPREMADEWIRSDAVGIGGKIAIGNGHFLDVLIEKDFPCKSSDSPEDSKDLFGELSDKAEC